ncbi:group 1 glycosyl transferase [Xenorhabdus beddingii]|uniref:Group 1 glycosyl transferase n=1 Tax=Xenorhabdus beddingii TaxID=40578 RepID=A0A1Y2SK31_9GAMM|nr:glycosyltransferase [Xenorhabdus beddingii]OTA19168.1 group 1 glycosyl transferase [Xenorhabdus beddingii]
MKKDIKVAFILPSLANRGPIIFTRYLVSQLVNMVSFVKIYYFDDIVEVDFACDVQRINFWEKINFSFYDIVHSTMFRPDLYVIKNKKTISENKCITVCGLHNYIKEDMIFNYGLLKGKVISTIWLHALRYFDFHIYSSKNMEDYYNINNKNHKGIIIPYGINRVNFSHDIDLPFIDKIIELKKKQYKIIGSVGLLIRRKGFHQILLALVELKQHAFVLIGDGPEKENLINLAKKLNVSDRVIFTGFHEQSSQYYKYIDLYCLCSYSEGFGLAMLESLSVDIPLICSKLPIYDNFFSDEHVGLFTPDNINELVKKINFVTQHSHQFQQFSNYLFNKYFSSNIMAIKHSNFYMTISGKNSTI